MNPLDPPVLPDRAGLIFEAIETYEALRSRARLAGLKQSAANGWAAGGDRSLDNPQVRRRVRRRKPPTLRPVATILVSDAVNADTGITIKWKNRVSGRVRPLVEVQEWADEMSRPGRRIEVRGTPLGTVSALAVWLDEPDTYKPGQRFTSGHLLDLSDSAQGFVTRDELAAVLSEFFLLIARHEEREHFRVGGELWCDPHQDHSRNIYR